MQNNETICCIICVGAQLTLGGQDIFARKCMYEKIIKRAAKTGFEIQSYIPRTYEMKNRILSKNKGCLFILLPKSTARILNDVCPKNTFSPELGGGKCPLPPVSYAYELHECISVKAAKRKSQVATAAVTYYKAFTCHRVHFCLWST